MLVMKGGLLRLWSHIRYVCYVLFCFSCLLCMAMAQEKSPLISHESRFGSARFMGYLSDENISEASGMAASHRTKNLFWTHNDGGNPAVIYALWENGSVLGQVRLTQAKNIDWEDMASFTWKKRHFLLIADVGDNSSKRKQCTLYIIEEPSLTDIKGEDPGISPRWRIDFIYEDGPRDCEAVAVDVSTGHCLLLSKRDDPPRLYRLPLFSPPGKSPGVAVKISLISALPPPGLEDLFQPYGGNRSQPTAMDMTSDGQNLVILTYKNAYLYSKNIHQTWPERLGGYPEIIHLPPVGFDSLLQREGLCFSSDGMSLYLTSEKLPAPLFRLDRVFN